MISEKVEVRLEDDSCGVVVSGRIEIGCLVEIELNNENGHLIVKSGKIAEIF